MVQSIRLVSTTTPFTAVDFLCLVGDNRNSCARLSFQITHDRRQNKHVTFVTGENILAFTVREGTLCVIRAIGGNPGPLQLEVLRLENTTDAGMEFEAAREADSIVATRSQWVEVRNGAVGLQVLCLALTLTTLAPLAIISRLYYRKIPSRLAANCCDLLSALLKTRHCYRRRFRRKRGRAGGGWRRAHVSGPQGRFTRGTAVSWAYTLAKLYRPFLARAQGTSTRSHHSRESVSKRLSCIDVIKKC